MKQVHLGLHIGHVMRRDHPDHARSADHRPAPMRAAPRRSARLRPHVVARDARARRSSARRSASVAEGARTRSARSCASIGAMRVGRDHGPSRNIDVGRPRYAAASTRTRIVGPAGQRSFPGRARVGEVARRPLRRRRRERRHVESGGVEQRPPVRRCGRRRRRLDLRRHGLEFDQPCPARRARDHVMPDTVIGGSLGVTLRLRSASARALRGLVRYQNIIAAGVPRAAARPIAAGV